MNFISMKTNIVLALAGSLLVLSSCATKPSEQPRTLEEGYQQLSVKLIGRWKAQSYRSEYIFLEDGTAARMDAGEVFNATYKIEASDLSKSTLYISFVIDGGGGHYKKLVFSEDGESIRESINTKTINDSFGSNDIWLRIN